MQLRRMVIGLDKKINKIINNCFTCIYGLRRDFHLIFLRLSLNSQPVLYINVASSMFEVVGSL